MYAQYQANCFVSADTLTAYHGTLNFAPVLTSGQLMSEGSKKSCDLGKT